MRLPARNTTIIFNAGLAIGFLRYQAAPSMNEALPRLDLLQKGMKCICSASAPAAGIAECSDGTTSTPAILPLRMRVGPFLCDSDSGGRPPPTKPTIAAVMGMKVLCLSSLAVLGGFFQQPHFFDCFPE